jgi:hypothetical protein
MVLLPTWKDLAAFGDQKIEIQRKDMASIILKLGTKLGPKSGSLGSYSNPEWRGLLRKAMHPSITLLSTPGHLLCARLHKHSLI